MPNKSGHRGFGHIRKLPSKRWQASYIGPDLQRHKAPQTFETRLDAETWVSAESHLISAEAWHSPAARAAAKRDSEAARIGNVFRAYAGSWLDGRHDLRPTTRASYTTALNRHLLPTFGEIPIDEITTAIIRAWFNAYGKRTPTARAHAYQVLYGIMSQAEDDELIARNPVRIRAGGRTKVEREPEVLTLNELFDLVDAMPEKHRALTLICGLGGLRFGEAVALRRRDVDLKLGIVRVVQNASRAAGQKQVGPPKTDAGRRDVALPAVALDALREHMNGSTVRGRDGLVFPGGDGELLAPTALYGRVARIEKRNGKQYPKAGYGFYAAREAIGKPTLHWHDLRRTAATLGAQHGATVREMQHRLGHTTPAMALHYQHATADRDRAVADRLQAAVNVRRSEIDRLSARMPSATLP